MTVIYRRINIATKNDVLYNGKALSAVLDFLLTVWLSFTVVYIGKELLYYA